jgi:hypothetical protein
MFLKKPDADPAQAAYRDRYKRVRYRPLSKRRRLLIVLLALATAASLLLYILGRRGAIHDHPLLLPLRADVANCQGGKTSGCVGGMATVIMAAPPAASAP